MKLDPATLAAVACIMSAVIGALLLFSWANDRRIAALGWWSACCLTAALASALYLAGGPDAASVGRQAGNAFFALSFGLSYGAARRFNGKSMPWLLVCAGALAWLALVWGFHPQFYMRLVAMSLIVGGYGMITARELWVESVEGMPSQRAAAVVTAINAAYFLLRPLGGPGIQASRQGVPVEPTADWLAVVGLVIILYAMIFGFLIMSMAKEKADREHRRAALVDPLTGVCNRRAFMSKAGRLLAAAERGGRPAALMMFDLDHFKSVNDSHGHLVGDQTLVEFCAAAGARLPERATLGRLGGEEFAIFIDGYDHARAVELAESIRVDLADIAAVVMGRPVAATVSAGVAASVQDRSTLAGLLAAADAALYRAKAQGRNRVVAELYSREAPPRASPSAMAAA